MHPNRKYPNYCILRSELCRSVRALNLSHTHLKQFDWLLKYAEPISLAEFYARNFLFSTVQIKQEFQIDTVYFDCQRMQNKFEFDPFNLVKSEI